MMSIVDGILILQYCSWLQYRRTFGGYTYNMPPHAPRAMNLLAPCHDPMLLSVDKLSEEEKVVIHSMWPLYYENVKHIIFSRNLCQVGI